MGLAVIEVSEEPHLGCAKFAARFGMEALRFVNSRVGRGLRLRGLNARILTSGTVRPGDRIRKLPQPEPGQAVPHQSPAGTNPSRAVDLPDGGLAAARGGDGSASV